MPEEEEKKGYQQPSPIQSQEEESASKTGESDDVNLLMQSSDFRNRTTLSLIEHQKKTLTM